MPDRIVRQGILTSRAVNRLSRPAEVFYRRLLSVVDDYGRYDARAEILLAALYPLQMRDTTEEHIEEWLCEGAHNGLLVRYVVAGEPYLEVAKFGQRLRAKTSKWPPPPSSDSARGHQRASAGIRGQMTADAAKCPTALSSAGLYGDGVGYGDDSNREVGTTTGGIYPEEGGYPPTPHPAVEAGDA